MARKEYSGAGRLFGNGSVLGDALNIDVSIGGPTSRVVTTGGNTGEVKSDPTMAKVTVSHAVPKTGADLLKIRRWHRASTDVTWKVLVGNNIAVIRGKVSSFKMSAAAGKGEFSLEIEGDAQGVG